MTHNLKNTKLSIMGCGWLGLPLAKHLIQQGVQINGSTTTATKEDILKAENINPFVITLTETKVSANIANFFDHSETLILNIPPGIRRNPEKNHVSEIKNIITYIEQSSIKNVLYISSTSVYKDEESMQLITEASEPNAITNNGKQLIAIENLLQSNSKFKTTILRFSGLIDDQRHPAKMLSGRSDISNGKAPINLIHKTDCIGIITRILETQAWNTVYNASYPFHPSKIDYYTNYCKTKNLELPIFNKKTAKGKCIDSSKLAQQLNYSFKTSP